MMKGKRQEGAGTRGRQESHVGVKDARKQGFCLTINDTLLKNRMEGPQASHFEPKSWRKLQMQVAW